MAGTLGISLAALLLAPAAALAQDSIAVGTRVKVRAHYVPGIEGQQPTELRGTVAGHAGDTLLLRIEPQKAPAADVVAIPLASVSYLARSRGHGPQPLRGAWYGFGSAVGLGLVTLSALCGEEDIDPGPGEDTPETCSLSDVGHILLGTAALSVVGGAVGLVVGTVVGGERWKSAPLESLRISVRSAPDGSVGLGLVVHF
ncbi:MAG TPA: hypothetical protein VFU41_09590 [Gemmatimonadales bacterium]|nr:hypothetical protein [Gemmatimonadales bacterium]